MVNDLTLSIRSLLLYPKTEWKYLTPPIALWSHPILTHPIGIPQLRWRGYFSWYSPPSSFSETKAVPDTNSSLSLSMVFFKTQNTPLAFLLDISHYVWLLILLHLKKLINRSVVYLVTWFHSFVWLHFTSIGFSIQCIQLISAHSIGWCGITYISTTYHDPFTLYWLLFNKYYNQYQLLLIVIFTLQLPKIIHGYFLHVQKKWKQIVYVDVLVLLHPKWLDIHTYEKTEAKACPRLTSFHRDAH